MVVLPNNIYFKLNESILVNLSNVLSKPLISNWWFFFEFDCRVSRTAEKERQIAQDVDILHTKIDLKTKDNKKRDSTRIVYKEVFQKRTNREALNDPTMSSN